MAGRERPYDDDNFVGGCKPIRDALVDMGYILGDGPSNAEFTYVQIHGDSSGLRVEIEDVE